MDEEPVPPKHVSPRLRCKPHRQPSRARVRKGGPDRVSTFRDWPDVRFVLREGIVQPGWVAALGGLCPFAAIAGIAGVPAFENDDLECHIIDADQPAR